MKILKYLKAIKQTINIFLIVYMKERLLKAKSELNQSKEINENKSNIRREYVSIKRSK